jgi:hypothetical protein
LEQQRAPSFERNLEFLRAPLLLDILRNLSGNKIFPAIPKDGTKERLDDLGWIPSGNAYFGQKGQGYTVKGYRLVFNDTLIRRKFPPKAFIGVGYKDKGSRRNKAQNGLPSWQDVATNVANKERVSSENLQGSPPIDSEGEA